jgi:hypothetical protein
MRKKMDGIPKKGSEVPVKDEMKGNGWMEGRTIGHRFVDRKSHEKDENKRKVKKLPRKWHAIYFRGDIFELPKFIIVFGELGK